MLNSVFQSTEDFWTSQTLWANACLQSHFHPRAQKYLGECGGGVLGLGGEREEQGDVNLTGQWDWGG